MASRRRPSTASERAPSILGDIKDVGGSLNKRRLSTASRLRGFFADKVDDKDDVDDEMWDKNDDAFLEEIAKDKQSMESARPSLEGVFGRTSTDGYQCPSFDGGSTRRPSMESLSVPRPASSASTRKEFGAAKGDAGQGASKAAYPPRAGQRGAKEQVKTRAKRSNSAASSIRLYSSEAGRVSIESLRKPPPTTPLPPLPPGAQDKRPSTSMGIYPDRRHGSLRLHRVATDDSGSIAGSLNRSRASAEPALRRPSSIGFYAQQHRHLRAGSDDAMSPGSFGARRRISRPDSSNNGRNNTKNELIREETSATPEIGGRARLPSLMSTGLGSDRSASSLQLSDVGLASPEVSRSQDAAIVDKLVRLGLATGPPTSRRSESEGQPASGAAKTPSGLLSSLKKRIVGAATALASPQVVHHSFVDATPRTSTFAQDAWPAARSQLNSSSFSLRSPSPALNRLGLGPIEQLADRATLASGSSENVHRSPSRLSVRSRSSRFERSDDATEDLAGPPDPTLSPPTPSPSIDTLRQLSPARRLKEVWAKAKSPALRLRRPGSRARTTEQEGEAQTPSVETLSLQDAVRLLDDQAADPEQPRGKPVPPPKLWISDPPVSTAELPCIASASVQAVDTAETEAEPRAPLTGPITAVLSPAESVVGDATLQPPASLVSPAPDGDGPAGERAGPPRASIQPGLLSPKPPRPPRSANRRTQTFSPLPTTLEHPGSSDSSKPSPGSGGELSLRRTASGDSNGSTPSFRASEGRDSNRSSRFSSARASSLFGSAHTMASPAISTFAEAPTSSTADADDGHLTAALFATITSSLQLTDPDLSLKIPSPSLSHRFSFNLDTRLNAAAESPVEEDSGVDAVDPAPEADARAGGSSLRPDSLSTSPLGRRAPRRSASDNASVLAASSVSAGSTSALEASSTRRAASAYPSVRRKRLTGTVKLRPGVIDTVGSNSAAGGALGGIVALESSPEDEAEVVKGAAEESGADGETEEQRAVIGVKSEPEAEVPRSADSKSGTLGLATPSTGTSHGLASAVLDEIVFIHATRSRRSSSADAKRLDATIPYDVDEERSPYTGTMRESRRSSSPAVPVSAASTEQAAEDTEANAEPPERATLLVEEEDQAAKVGKESEDDDKNVQHATLPQRWGLDDEEDEELVATAAIVPSPSFEDLRASVPAVRGLAIVKKAKADPHASKDAPVPAAGGGAGGGGGGNGSDSIQLRRRPSLQEVRVTPPNLNLLASRKRYITQPPQPLQLQRNRQRCASESDHTTPLRRDADPDEDESQPGFYRPRKTSAASLSEAQLSRKYAFM